MTKNQFTEAYINGDWEALSQFYDKVTDTLRTLKDDFDHFIKYIDDPAALNQESFEASKESIEKLNI